MSVTPPAAPGLAIPSNLTVKHEAHFQKVAEFAARTGRTAQLQERLARLCSGNVQIALYADFAPYSFGFDMTLPSGAVIVGGLIYHGPLEDGSRAETLTVTLTPSSGWEIHT